MTAFEDFVNLELPRRSSFLTVAIAGFDGDPNSASAPDILKGAPVGTWYQRDTPIKIYRKLTASATGWDVEGLPGPPSSDSTTLEDLTIPVDYNDGSAVEVPSTAIFNQQSDVTDALAGASNFKHLQPVFNALPQFPVNQVDINVAAGIQRPEPGGVFIDAFTTVGWLLSGKTFSNLFNINGAPSSTWAAFDPSLVTIAVDSETPGGPRPSVFFGTTNPGLVAGFDCRGRFIEFDTGQVSVIAGQTGDTLFLSSEISPTGTSTATIKEGPSTIFRNSIDDIAVFGNTGLAIRGNLSAGAFSGPTLVDLRFQKLSNSFQRDVLSEGVGVGLNPTRCMWDADAVGTGNGQALLVGDGSTVSATLCSWLNISVSGPDEPILVVRQGLFSPFQCAVFGFDTPIRLSGGSEIRAFGFVVDGVGGSGGGPGMVSVIDSRIDFFTSGAFGHENVMRNAPAGRSGLSIDYNTTYFDFGSNFARALTPMLVVFEDNAGPCIRIGSHIDLDLTIQGLPAFLDGGGNLDVGIEFIASQSRIKLESATDVTGTAGDVRMADGVILSYGDIETLGPFLDEQGNIIEKIP